MAALCIGSDAGALPQLCAITGNLSLIFGQAAAGATVRFQITYAANAQNSILVPSYQSVVADANGNLPTLGGCYPTGVQACLPYGATVRVTILPPPPLNVANLSPSTVTIPLQPSADLAQLILEDPPPPSIVTGILCTGCSSVLNPGPGGVGQASIVVSGGSGFPLTGNVSAGNYEIQNLAPNVNPGDALSQGYSHLNDLNTATGNYSMGGNRLEDLLTPGAAGDALSDGNAIGVYGINTISGTKVAAHTVWVNYIQTLTETSGTLAPTGPTLNSTTGGPVAKIIISDSSNFTIGNPGGAPATSQTANWWIWIVNTSGGSAGTITLGSQYEADSSWGAPANGKIRMCPVMTAYNGSVEHSYIGVCTGDLTY
jgi:hypothetical protein